MSEYTLARLRQGGVFSFSPAHREALTTFRRMSIDFGLLHGLATSVANKEHHGRILYNVVCCSIWTAGRRWNGATVIGMWGARWRRTDNGYHRGELINLVVVTIYVPMVLSYYPEK